MMKVTVFMRLQVYMVLPYHYRDDGDIDHHIITVGQVPNQSDYHWPGYGLPQLGGALSNHLTVSRGPCQQHSHHRLHHEVRTRSL